MSTHGKSINDGNVVLGNVFSESQNPGMSMENLRIEDAVHSSGDQIEDFDGHLQTPFTRANIIDVLQENVEESGVI